MKRITLIIGGSRSGKSKIALQLAAPYRNKVFVATAEATDDEMLARIERHRRERDPSYLTVEEPVDLNMALKSLPKETEVAVLDCITVWLGNLSYREKVIDQTCPEIDGFLEILHSPPCHLILVTNEIGMGVIPADSATRQFRDLAGSLNQQLAERAHEIILSVSGISLRIK
ncbi:MAG: bifunctional adenosylcobinamide kinase/adenosylcobinamide-phosphate guanylyltransferase [Deltaproteobacteria bacterium]|jgi:adenosylcobinamide kinase/adenosylcobinamide-phosphate guanylyltransferase|nr:bifunctional adenosylcobinamide kinase/adenosylcobinamide-phosphate guanylyltransferase [Deltaproteobacteria bacterium]